MITKIKIALVTILTINLGVKGQEKITTENGIKSDFIYKNGNIGVGTNNPLEKVQIENGALQFLNYGNIDNVDIIKIGENSATANEFSMQGLFAGEGATNNFLKFRTVWNDNSLVLRGDGNIGVSTNNPLEKIQIENGALQFLNYGNIDNVDIIKIGENSATTNEFSMQGLFAGEGATNNFLKFRTVWNDNSLVLRGDGNIGVGTTNPDAKLTVAGKIHSREVKVTATAGGADFVFENDYNLPSLKTVESYIKENKHLPEIASAKEMDENGLNLAEMNIKLLQKIEELTLYTINQEKKITEQGEKIENLEVLNKKLFELQSRLEKLESKK